MTLLPLSKPASVKDTGALPVVLIRTPSAVVAVDLPPSTIVLPAAVEVFVLVPSV